MWSVQKGKPTKGRPGTVAGQRTNDDPSLVLVGGGPRRMEAARSSRTRTQKFPRWQKRGARRSLPFPLT